MAVVKLGNAALLLVLAACSAEPSVANATAVDGAADGAVTGLGAGSAGMPPRAATMPGKDAVKPGNEQFADYWRRFRKAALSNDAAGVTAASAARVKTHGMLDSDPEGAVAAAAVPPLVARALASDEGIDAAQRTLRQTLQGNDVPRRGPDDPLGYRRVGAFVFEQVKGRWFLTELYLEE